MAPAGPNLNCKRMSMHRHSEYLIVYQGVSWVKHQISRGDADTMIVSKTFVYQNELYAVGAIYDITGNGNSSDDYKAIGVVKMEMPTSISESPFSQQSSIYPNPTNGTIAVTHPSQKELKYTLYNTQGSLCQTGVTSTGGLIDMTDLPKGIYALHLANADSESQSIVRVVKQ